MSQPAGGQGCTTRSQVAAVRGGHGSPAPQREHGRERGSGASPMCPMDTSHQNTAVVQGAGRLRYLRGVMCVSWHWFEIKQKHPRPFVKNPNFSLSASAASPPASRETQPLPAFGAWHSPAPALPRVPGQHLRSAPVPPRASGAARSRYPGRAGAGGRAQLCPQESHGSRSASRRYRPARPGPALGSAHPAPPAPRLRARGPCGRGSQRAARRACAAGRALLIPLWSGRGDICNWRRRREP